MRATRSPEQCAHFPVCNSYQLPFSLEPHSERLRSLVPISIPVAVILAHDAVDRVRSKVRNRGSLEGHCNV